MNNEFYKRFLSSIIILPLFFFFIIKGSYIFILFLIILLSISIYEWFSISYNVKLKVLGLFFLILSFYFTFLTRNQNFNFFILIIIICVSTDLGGYVFGKILKGPKLTKISPNKTISGMIGSFILAYLNTYIYILNFQFILNADQIIFYNNSLLFIIFLISGVSQIGDLVLSYFKRIKKVKDTGRLFPGHGGLLDRIDGMIFAFPFSYLIIF